MKSKMLLFNFVFLTLAACVFGAPAEKVDLEKWKAPADMQEKFPYYHSGYDSDNRPIWIFEVGKYPFKAFVDQGPEAVKNIKIYADQIGYRINQSLTSKKEKNTVSDVILDFDGLDVQQFLNPKTLGLVMTILKQLNLEEAGDGVGHSVMMNVSPTVKSLLSFAKPQLGHSLDHVGIYGKKEEWLPKFQKMFPRDQIPEWYGGSKDYKPLKVYG